MTYVISEEVDRQANWLLKDVGKAIRDFDMIQEGDRIAVAVSGGKDSLSLLRLLDIYLKISPIKYSLCAIHVQGDARGPECPIHSPLVNWLEASGYAYAVEPMIIPETENLPMGCRRCTWNRRRTLFEMAHRLGCKVVAMGHHADDLAQTTLLNLIFSGSLETMAPKSDYFDGVFHLIRPLCYLPEKKIRRFARICDFPQPPPTCPRSDDSRRQRVADLIKQAEPWGKDIRVNLLRAGLKGIGFNGGIDDTKE
jgi:tRNA 2-thiocytidine biosynthesis protein TtcA